MAIHHRFTTDASMELPEFMEYADAKTNMSDVDSLLALGEQLSMLGNNRRFLSKFLEDFIEANWNLDSLTATISQSVMLRSGRDFYLRANFWLPEAEMTESEALLFAYHQAHDHNFDLLSYAYSGSGYTTDLYEYDYSSVAGYVGEQVNLVPRGNHRHACADTLLYRCNRDIHFQRPPETPSITLNVIPTANQYGLQDQYFFDIEKGDSESGVLSRYAESNIESRRFLFNVAKYVRSERLVRVMCDLITTYPCRRTRYEALRALRECDADAHDTMVHHLRDDPAPIIRQYVHRVLSGVPASA